MKSLIRFRASEHFLWRHEHVRAHIADEVVFDRAAARLLLVEQISLLCELGILAIERIARKPHYELINPVLAENIIARSEAIYAAGPVAVWNAKQAAKESKLARELAKSDNDTDKSGNPPESAS